VLSKSKLSLLCIVSLIIFSCYLFDSEVLAYSFDRNGNIEIELLAEAVSQQPTKQIPEKDSQQTPHKNIVLTHLLSLEDSETKTSLISPCAAAFIQQQLFSIRFLEKLPNAHLLSHQELPHQILSKLSSTILII